MPISRTGWLDQERVTIFKGVIFKRVHFGDEMLVLTKDDLKTSPHGYMKRLGPSVYEFIFELDRNQAKLRIDHSRDKS